MSSQSIWVARFLTAIASAVLLLGACGQGERRLAALNLPTSAPATALTGGLQVDWPTALPVDALQPWETVDLAGHVVPPARHGKGAASINLQTEFIPGVERYLETAGVSDFGEASRFASGEPGAEGVAYAIYRLPLGAGQPGCLAAEVNLRLKSDSTPSDYYLGVADYSANTWHWQGPFAVSHVRFTLPAGAYTSALGNLMLAVVAYDGSQFDLVGLGVNVRDDADTEAPPALADAPWVSPYSGTVLVEWPPVTADDLAGYRVYFNGMAQLNYLEGGTAVALPASGVVSVQVSAVDISGNESALSPVTEQGVEAGAAPVAELTASAASGRRGEVIALTASGGETYDWDLNGDGTWELVGTDADSAFADTTNLGLIRPCIYAHTAEGGFWMGAVSLIIAGNSRPVAHATVDVSSGPAPLEVEFTLTGDDDDGDIVEWAWDFEGDGVYEGVTGVDPNPISHTYSAPGLFNAKFRVTDNEGAWDVDTVAVQVLPDPDNQMPIIEQITAAPSLCTPGTLVTFTAAASDPDGIITAWGWDFDGDGADDAVEQNPAHTFVAVGFYNVRLRVVDEAGGYAVGYVGVHVQEEVPNMPPVALLSVDENTAFRGFDTDYEVVTLDASSSYDPEGGALEYSWDYDGNGTFTAWSSTATYDYSVSGEPRTITSRVRVRDGAGAVSEASVEVKLYRFLNYAACSSSASMGWYPSLRVIGGRPAAAHFDYDNYDLVYSYARTLPALSEEGWLSHTVDSGGSVGWEPSLNRQAANKWPAIAYYDRTNSDLKFARATSANVDDTSDWSVHTVDSAGTVGHFPSFASFSIGLIFPTRYMVIAYYDSSNADLKFAYTTSTSPTGPGDWTIHAVDSAGSVGVRPSVCVFSVGTLVNPDYRVGIFYHDATNGDLKFAYSSTWPANDPGDWTFHVIDDGAGNVVGVYNSAVPTATSSLFPMVTYYDSTADALKFAQSTVRFPDSTDDWVVYELYASAGKSSSCIYYHGEPLVVFVDHANDRIRMARAQTQTPVDETEWWFHEVTLYVDPDIYGTALVEFEDKPLFAYTDYGGPVTDETLTIGWPVTY